MFREISSIVVGVPFKTIDFIKQGSRGVSDLTYILCNAQTKR